MADEINPYDAGAQQESDALAADDARLQRNRETGDFLWLMGNKSGRRVMWRLLGMTGVFRNPFTPGGDGQTEFHCGMQNIGQQLVAEIHALCPEKYHVMVREQVKQ